MSPAKKKSLPEIILEQEGIDFALFDENLNLEIKSDKFDAGTLKNGAQISEVVPELAQMENAIRASLSQGNEFLIQRINRRQNDKDLYIDLRLIPFEGKVLVVVRDVSRYGMLEQSIIQQRNETILLKSQIEKSYKRLEEISDLDDLTKLFNRRAARQLFNYKLQQAQANSQPLSVLFIDMDNFKTINDCYGHENGDVALKFTANILRTYIRIEDTAIRWGGDEFVVILSDSAYEGSQRVASLLLDMFDKHSVYLSDNESFHIKASIGICQVSLNALKTATAQRIIRAADRAMYISKEKGGKQVTCIELEDAEE
ncbi:MAG: GGDEF domain-containing protein [Anaerolineales bacterium]|nr:GGDEF domain-containing protein [Anaerolineales bacterium]